MFGEVFLVIGLCCLVVGMYYIIRWIIAPNDDEYIQGYEDDE